MIDSLVLNNWQRWDHLTLDLARVTVLAGDNETGKTAVVRALYWLLLNRFDGPALDFVTWGGDAAEVAASLDGRTLVRRQSAKANEYALDGRTLKNFHPGVPQEVADLARVSAANFQFQGDPHYWLTLPGPDAAAELNELFSLAAIDAVSSFLAAELRRSQAEGRAAAARRDAAAAEVKALSWADAADADLRELEKLHAELTERRRRLAAIRTAAAQVTRLEARLDALREARSRAEELLKLGVRLAAVTASANRLTDIHRREQTLWQKRKQLAESERQLAAWLEGTCPLCGRG